MKRNVLILFLAAILCGCSYFSGSEEPVAATDMQTPESTEQIVYTPTNYGTLNVSIREPKTLNPLLNEDATVDRVLKLMFEPLFKLDASFKPQPNLAEAMELAPDGLSAVITLKSGLKWSDGETITPNDLIYSLDVLRLEASERAVYKDTISNISLYRAVDENSVKITFKNQFGGASYSMCFPLIPKHYYDKKAVDMEPLGNGLYKFESFTSADKLTLSRSTNAFNREPYINEINALITSDNQTDLYSYEQSLIDVVTSNLSDWAKYSGRQDTEITEYTTTYFDFIGFNFKNPLFQDKEIRIAVAEALPLENIVNEIYSGHAERALSPVNPNSWLYEPNLTAYSHNPAVEKFSRAESDEQSSIKLLVNVENEERMKIADMIKQNLEKAGLTIELEKLGFEEYEKKLEEGDFDMFVGGFNLSAEPDLTFAFHSSQGTGGKNYFSYSNDEMDELLSQAFFAADEAGYKTAVSKIQMHIAEELPCISIAFRKSALLSKDSVKGEIKPLSSNIFDNINEWFIME